MSRPQFQGSRYPLILLRSTAYDTIGQDFYRRILQFPNWPMTCGVVSIAQTLIFNRCNSDSAVPNPGQLAPGQMAQTDVGGHRCAISASACS